MIESHLWEISYITILVIHVLLQRRKHKVIESILRKLPFQHCQCLRNIQPHVCNSIVSHIADHLNKPATHQILRHFAACHLRISRVTISNSNNVESSYAQHVFLVMNEVADDREQCVISKLFPIHNVQSLQDLGRVWTNRSHCVRRVTGDRKERDPYSQMIGRSSLYMISLPSCSLKRGISVKRYWRMCQSRSLLREINVGSKLDTRRCEDITYLSGEDQFRTFFILSKFPTMFNRTFVLVSMSSLE